MIDHYPVLYKGYPVRAGNWIKIDNWWWVITGFYSDASMLLATIDKEGKRRERIWHENVEWFTEARTKSIFAAQEVWKIVPRPDDVAYHPEEEGGDKGLERVAKGES